MNRSYKACKPEKTINNARNILDSLDIFMHEASWSHGNGLSNCRVTINNGKLGELSIGTNGKGRSYEYSLASGYAEFLERIQNGYRLSVSDWLVDMKNILKHTADMDLKQSIDDVLALYDAQKTASFDEIWSNNSAEIMALFPGIETKEQGKEYFAPYFDLDAIPVDTMYSITEEKEIDFPIILSRISTSTSGLCSGNTSTEAILHGFCEIFERYATRIIFTQNLTPPTIPLETYKNTDAYKVIKRLESENGVKIILKDCSLGLGLPVIGIVTIDTKNHIFNFKLGSEFVPEIAIERCLTEAYQTTSQSFKAEKLKHNSTDKSTMRWYHILKYGYGEWPLSIFGDKPSYPLWEFDKSYGVSDEQDLKTCLYLCEKLDTKIYIRDNSFLGFPSYQIIAPSISGVIYDSKDILDSFCYVSRQYEASLYENGVPTEDELADYLKLKANRAIEQKDRFDISKMIPFYKNSQLSGYSPYYILALIAYKNGDLVQAYSHMVDFLKTESSVPMFYHAFADYLEMKNAGITETSVMSIISNKYGRNTAILLFSRFSIPSNVLYAADILPHFDFDEWSKGDCSHFCDMLDVVKRVEERKIKWQPDHSKVAELFV